MFSLQILSLRFHKCESCFLKLRLTPNTDPTMRNFFLLKKIFLYFNLQKGKAFNLLNYHVLPQEKKNIFLKLILRIKFRDNQEKQRMKEGTTAPRMQATFRS